MALPVPGFTQSAPAPDNVTKAWSQLTTAELVERAPDTAWENLDQGRLLYLFFAKDTAQSMPARVIILLAPDFAPDHVAALQELVTKDFFKGREIVRNQDNYVVQWGDGAAALALGYKGAKMASEFEQKIHAQFKAILLKDGDVYAPKVGFWKNWPVAWSPKENRYWLPHCYGMVGAGRDEAADSGGPAELYAVTGHSPRALDRNVTLLGRVVDGMDQLTSLPRGSEPMGFYSGLQQKPKIITMKLGSAMPIEQQVALQALRSDHPIYTEVLESRRNRRDSWTKYKAGKLEICNAPLPVRKNPIK
ncbi:peptidylprolyl isomerase [Candidatus Phycosocius spiralis]|uniref:peptidylprolyl isomerase n=1 Tax=Candidatus Phycosocius spiralis TaxID=2815099 RepID=A0ABQ4PSE5_9PROT|nr:peptidylprolyl isomerase [Candidatus Phycosocius spiralis]GIU65936.1 peptidyl-prolyl cis-trans isomerase [Candidatus Phycosocius spiralis]